MAQVSWSPQWKFCQNKRKFALQEMLYSRLAAVGPVACSRFLVGAMLRPLAARGLRTFDRLFRTVTRYKLADGATLALANRLPDGAPRNLRMLFSKAVERKETTPRLRIEKTVEGSGSSGLSAPAASHSPRRPQTSARGLKYLLTSSGRAPWA